MIREVFVGKVRCCGQYPLALLLLIGVTTQHLDFVDILPFLIPSQSGLNLIAFPSLGADRTIAVSIESRSRGWRTIHILTCVDDIQWSLHAQLKSFDNLPGSKCRCQHIVYFRLCVHLTQVGNRIRRLAVTYEIARFKRICIIVTTVSIIDRNSRWGTDGLFQQTAHTVRIAAEWIGTTLSALWDITLQTDSYVLENVTFIVDAGTEALKVSTTNHTILIEIVPWNQEPLHIRSTAHRELMLLGGGCAEECILPIGSSTPGFNKFRSYASSSLLGICGQVEIKFTPLFCVEQIKTLTHLWHTDRVTIIYVYTPMLTVLGCHDDHTIGTSWTIDGRCRHILQNLYRLNVGGIDGSQRIEVAASKWSASSGSIIAIVNQYTVNHV